MASWSAFPTLPTRNLSSPSLSLSPSAKSVSGVSPLSFLLAPAPAPAPAPSFFFFFQMSCAEPLFYGGYSSSSFTTNPFPSRTQAPSASTYAVRRQWHQLFLPLSSFTCPYTFGEALFRIKRNLAYFCFNYYTILLFILFLSLLWHPISLIVFIIVFVFWFFLYFSRNEPLVIFGWTIGERVVLVGLGVVTVVALFLTRVWLNVLVSVLIGGVFIGFHAAFRGTEDLYVDEYESADGGLLSVVGSPILSGISRVQTI